MHLVGHERHAPAAGFGPLAVDGEQQPAHDVRQPRRGRQFDVEAAMYLKSVMLPEFTPGEEAAPSPFAGMLSLQVEVVGILEELVAQPALKFDEFHVY